MTPQRPIGVALRRVTLTGGQGWCAADSDTPPMPRPLARWLARRWTRDGVVYRVINVYNWETE